MKLKISGFIAPHEPIPLEQFPRHATLVTTPTYPRLILLPFRNVLTDLPTQPRFFKVLYLESALGGRIMAERDLDRRSHYLPRADFDILKQTVNAIPR